MRTARDLPAVVGERQGEPVIYLGRCAMKRVLQITEFVTQKVVKEVDVTGRSENSIERIERGMLINLNRDKYYVQAAVRE